MTTERYYTILLESARKSHSANIREARKWRYCLRDACLQEARSDYEAARKYIRIIRAERHAN